MRRGLRVRQLWILSLFAVTLAALLSCENTLVSSSNSLQESILIDTSVRAGGVLTSGESVDLSFPSYGEDVFPRRLEVEAVDVHGEIVEEFRIEDPLDALPLPSVGLGNREEGLYFVRTRLYGEEEELIEEREIPVFVSSGRPVIERLETYPPSALRPNAGGVVIPRVTAADNAWVRWNRDGKPLEEGLLSEYSEGFSWRAPESEGVYSISLEVFPFPPPKELGDSYGFSSAVSAQVQFYVQRDAPLNLQELGPEESYLHLLHLRGSAENRGVFAVPFRITGDPTLVVYGDLFGYRMSPGTALEAPTSLLPSYSGSGALSPFSLTFVGKINPPETGSEDTYTQRSSLVEVKTAEGEPYMQLFIERGGIPYLRLRGVEDEIPAPQIDMYRLRELTLSVIPYNSGSPNEGSAEGASVDAVGLKWYVDGTLVSSSTEAYTPVTPPRNGLTVIGGEDGFSGIIDEVGLFYRDSLGRGSADTDVFLRNEIRERGREAVYFAEGFENGRGLRDGLRIAGGMEEVLAELDEEWEELELCVRSMGNSGQAELRFSDEEGTLLNLPLEEKEEGEKFCVILYQKDRKISLHTPTGEDRAGEKQVSTAKKKSKGTVKISVRVPEDNDGALELQEVLILRSATGLVAKKR